MKRQLHEVYGYGTRLPTCSDRVLGIALVIILCILVGIVITGWFILW